MFGWFKKKNPNKQLLKSLAQVDNAVLKVKREELEIQNKLLNELELKAVKLHGNVTKVPFGHLSQQLQKTNERIAVLKMELRK